MQERAAAEDVRAVLGEAEVRDNVVYLKQLDGNLYRRVKKALERIGGTWNRRKQGFAFEEDPSEVLAGVVAGGKVASPERVRAAFWPTPPEVAALVVEQFTRTSDLSARGRMLEPSAGEGAFVEAIREVNGVVGLTAVEPSIERARCIPTDEYTELVGGTFEEFALAHRDARFDAVVMNPPFSSLENPTLWVDHFWLAWKMLAPLGEVTCIAPNGFTYREDQRHCEVRRLVDDTGEWEELDAEAFGGVHTVVIRAKRLDVNEQVKRAGATDAPSLFS